MGAKNAIQQAAQAVQEAVSPKHSKESLLLSQKYAEHRDLLMVLLEDGKDYHKAEVDELIKKYREEKIK